MLIAEANFKLFTVFTLYYRRSLFDNTIKQHFKNAVYIPMKGTKVSETDNSPLVAPTKSAFERFLVTVSLVEPDSRA